MERHGNYLLNYAVVTQHTKQLLYYNRLHSATCFGRYRAIIRPTSNSIIKTHSLDFPMGSIVYINIFRILRPPHRTVKYKHKHRTITYKHKHRTITYKHKHRIITYKRKHRTITYKHKHRTITYKHKHRTITYKHKHRTITYRHKHHTITYKHKHRTITYTHTQSDKRPSLQSGASKSYIYIRFLLNFISVPF